MKKWAFFILLSVVLAAALIGCTRIEAADTDKLSVVTTIFAPYDFTREIAGDKADITMLLPPGSESHSFEATPRDIITIQNCDVFIYVGGESDDWVARILESMNTDNMKIITLMDCTEVVEEVIVEGMEDDEHDHGHGGHADEEHEGEEHADSHEGEEHADSHEGEEHADSHEGEEHADSHEDEEHHDSHEGEEPVYDEHVWTSPRNAKLIVQRISDTLCEIDSANADVYRKNTGDYIAELDELDARFKNVTDNAVRKTIVFGDRFPFRYLADAYGLKYFAAFPGCSTETEASAATVKFLIDKVNEEKIPAVFHIELSNENMVNAISEATGAKSLLLHACHNISRDDFTAGASYIKLMTQNAETLKEALW